MATQKTSSWRPTVEVRIGVANAPREVVLESDETPDSIQAAVKAAVADGSLLDLVDDKGRHVLVPGAHIVFVEVGAPAKGRVGFGVVQ
jgi:hypothetical protein